MIEHQSRRTYKDNKILLNPNNYKLSRTDYHLEHKVSKHVGWILGLPVDVMSNINNLEIMYYADNISKHIKCSLHPLELLKLCGYDITPYIDKIPLIEQFLL